MTKLAEYRKAIAGILVPGLVVLGASLLESSVGGSAVTHAEWVAVALAALGTGVAVERIPNKPQTRTRRKPAEPALPDQLS